jgi:hypothetical protein
LNPPPGPRRIQELQLRLRRTSQASSYRHKAALVKLIDKPVDVSTATWLDALSRDSVRGHKQAGPRQEI